MGAIPFLVCSFQGRFDLARVLEDHEHGDCIILNQDRWSDAGEFQQAILETKALAADFDGTVNVWNQWEHMRDCMRADLRLQDEDDARDYFHSQRTDHGDAEFVERSVKRLVESGLTVGRLWKEAAKLLPRDGARELCESYGGGSRVAIVSYGLKPMILAWGQHHGIQIGEQYAAELLWKDIALPMRNWTLAGCVSGTIVTEGNKASAREKFSRRLNVPDSLVLVLEDTPRMLARMMAPENVGVLIVPHVDLQEHRKTSRLRQLAHPGMIAGIDAILVSDSLTALVEMRRRA